MLLTPFSMTYILLEISLYPRLYKLYESQKDRGCLIETFECGGCGGGNFNDSRFATYYNY